MPITNSAADISLFRTTYQKITSLGEVMKGQDFLMTIEGHDDLTYLVQSTSVPPMKREVVETVGPFGVRSIQQGRYMNEVEMQITFKEVVSGVAYIALRAWVADKAYKTVTLKLVGESNKTALDQHKWELDDCWLELDGGDLSVEDAVPLKPSGTLHGSYLPA